MKKRFKAFTLVEMLIVMGIIIILMSVGITAGRYAINRANDVAHQNAVDNFYTAVQAFYADNRKYPVPVAGIGFEEMLTDTTTTGYEAYYIGEYMEEGAFDGGTEATYFYDTDDLAQEVIICVSLFGLSNNNNRPGDFYCNGNGFGSSSMGIVDIDEKIINRGDTLHTTPNDQSFDMYQDWNGEDWGTIY
jgi:type II secretory pathway pseudopilin PulG